MMEYVEGLLILRFLLHVATAYMIVQFDIRGKNFRWTAALTAAAIGGASLGSAMQIVTQWDLLVASQPMPWVTIIIAAYFWKLYKAGGNVAKMFVKKDEVVNGTNK